MGRELGEEAAEFFAEAQMRTDDSERLRVEIRHVDGVANGSVEERGADGLRDFNSDAFLRLGGGSAEVRREDEIWRLTENGIRRERFGFENVERRSCHLAAVQGLGERRLVDQAAARAIDDANAASCLAKALGVEQVPRLRCEWRVKSDEIGVLEQLSKVIDQLHLKRPRACCGEVRVEGQDAHAEGNRAPAQLAADAAHADDAERLVIQLDALQFLPAPFAVAHHGIGLRKFPSGAEEKGEGVLRSGYGVAAGRVHHNDAAPGGGLNVHVVHADTCSPDDAEFCSGLEDGGGDFGFAPHHEAAEVGNEFD